MEISNSLGLETTHLDSKLKDPINGLYGLTGSGRIQLGFRFSCHCSDMLDLPRYRVNLRRHPSRPSTAGRDPDRRRHRRWSSTPVSPALASPLRKQHREPPFGVRPSPHATAAERAAATVAAFPLSLDWVRGLGFLGLRVRDEEAENREGDREK